MNKKAIKYSSGFIALLVIIILSVNVQPLDSERRRPVSEVFDVEEYVADLWENQLPGVLSDAVELPYLISLLKDKPEEAFENHSRKLGISNTHYFYFSASGIVQATDEETVLVLIDDNIPVELETVFVFGNAIRDGSGLVEIDEFLNMMDFNMVSVYLNRKVKSEVIEPFRKNVGTGNSVSFTGAAEINRREGIPERLKVIPIQIAIHNGD
jgi:predicted lipoprotein